jgi:hypothetical protein
MIIPSPAGMSLTTLSLVGYIKLFLTRESLVCDIPAGDGKKLSFFTVYLKNDRRHPEFHR